MDKILVILFEILHMLIGLNSVQGWDFGLAEIVVLGDKNRDTNKDNTR